MRIKVKTFWQDVRGRKVEAGEYDAGDLANNLAQYLVANGHAEIVSETPAQEAVKENVLPDTPAGNAVAERAELEKEYERLYDKAPHPATKDETLRQRIQDALDDTPDAND